MSLRSWWRWELCDFDRHVLFTMSVDLLATLVDLVEKIGRLRLAIVSGFAFEFFWGVSRRNYPSHSLVPSHGGFGVGGGAV